MRGYLFALRVHSIDRFQGLKQLLELLPFRNGGYPFPPGLAVAGAQLPSLPLPSVSQPGQVEDKKSEGILWGVPKHRKSVEKRLVKKFGLKEWTWKLLKPKYNLLVCDNCGHHYEAKHLCKNCYEKNKEETKIIREAMEAKFGHSPFDKDVIVLYDSDKEKGFYAEQSQTSPNQMIVELPKERPNFFSPNLLQKSTAGINRKAKDISVTQAPIIVHKDEN